MSFRYCLSPFDAICSQLHQGLEIESASADRLAELQKIYATASQTVALRQEELRNRELQELQVMKEASFLLSSFCVVSGREGASRRSFIVLYMHV